MWGLAVLTVSVEWCSVDLRCSCELHKRRKERRRWLAYMSAVEAAHEENATNETRQSDNIKRPPALPSSPRRRQVCLFLNLAANPLHRLEDDRVAAAAFSSPRLMTRCRVSRRFMKCERSPIISSKA
jgi:hypothetical protein